MKAIQQSLEWLDNHCFVMNKGIAVNLNGLKPAVWDTRIGSMYDPHTFLKAEKFYKSKAAGAKSSQNKGVCYQ